jgi:ferredoxin-2, mitochondrial
MKIIFVHGDRRVEVQALAGERLLDVAQGAAMPLEGTCEGAMACSTCHVIIGDQCYGRLPQASEDEEDMLDFAAGVTRHSRLACQILLEAAHDGMEVYLPSTVRNLLRRE